MGVGMMRRAYKLAAKKREQAKAKQAAAEKCQPKLAVVAPAGRVKANK